MQHQVVVLVPGWLWHKHLFPSVAGLSQFTRERVHYLHQMVHCIAFVGVGVHIWDLEGPFEYLLLPGWRVEAFHCHLRRKLLQRSSNTETVVSHPFVKVLFCSVDVVHIVNLTIDKHSLTDGHYLLALGLVVQNL